MFSLEDVKAPLTSAMPAELMEVRAKVGRKKRFMHTYNYVEANRLLLEGLKNEKIGFKIRARDANQLSIRVAPDAITILAKKVWELAALRELKQVMISIKSRLLQEQLWWCAILEPTLL